MKKYFFIILLSVLLSSCKKNPVAPENNNTFGLQLHIVDQNGNPTPGINISLQSINNLQIVAKKVEMTSIPNRIADIPKNFVLSQNYPNPFVTSTIILYSIPQSCFVNLLFYNLEGQKIETGFSGYKNAGSYKYNWDMNGDSSNHVLMIKFIASSDSTENPILFQDSIYAMIIPPNPEVGFVGKTNSDGDVIIKNKLFFPNLFNFPSIPITGPNSPEIIGSFTYSDTIKIILSNESFSKSISYDEIIKNGSNNYILKWTETTPMIKIGK